MENTRREKIIIRLLDEVVTDDGLCRFCGEINEHHGACRVWQLLPIDSENRIAITRDSYGNRLTHSDECELTIAEAGKLPYTPTCTCHVGCI